MIEEFYRWLCACIFVVAVWLLLNGCAMPPEKVDPLQAAWQRNARLCDQYGGIKRLDIEADHTLVYCREKKVFRIWHYK